MPSRQYWPARTCCLLAPTAGGKTEAAMLPLLSRMASEGWRGVSVLYVCPLKALLNNLEPRLQRYASFVGLRAGLWHGDIGDAARRRMLRDPPEILLITPESLEAILISVRVDHRALLGGVRTVVIDELHAFAGDDRGWHLRFLIARLERLAGHRIQRIGLSATVGNAEDLLRWLASGRAGRFIPFDADYRHTAQVEPACTESESEPESLRVPMEGFDRLMPSARGIEVSSAPGRPCSRM